MRIAHPFAPRPARDTGPSAPVADTGRRRRRPLAAWGWAALGCAALAGVPAARAQFAVTPSPLPAERQHSLAESERDYRQDAARHVYASYPMQVYKGRLPPLLHGVAVVETEVDDLGNVLDVRFKRPPSAPEVAPWIVQMIKKAGPFPPPAKIGRHVYQDVWLVHKAGRFQLDTLTEGQD